jgi:hypothetical protein
MKIAKRAVLTMRYHANHTVTSWNQLISLSFMIDWFLIIPKTTN